MSSTITIIGNVNCQHYQKVKCLAEFLKTSSEGRIEIRGFFEADFERICARVQSHVPLIDVEVLIFVEEKGEDRILQFGVKSFEEWVGKNYAIFSDDWQCGDFEENMKANAERDLRDLMNPERSYVRMNFVARENDYNGSVLIEFYDDICPKSCEFLKKKLSESSVTRAIKGGWIQLGEDGGAEGGIARESFAVHHEVGGIIGLCPSGAKPGLYGKELYITTKPLEHLDGNGVAVGRVLAGLRLVEKISEIDTMGFSNQKPRVEVMVEDVSEIGVKTGVKDNSDEREHRLPVQLPVHQIDVRCTSVCLFESPRRFGGHLRPVRVYFDQPHGEHGHQHHAGSSVAVAIHGLLFAAVHLVLLQSVSYESEVSKVGPQLIWSGYDKLLVEASLMVFIAEFTNNTVYLKFLLSRVFLSAGLYAIVKNDLAWTSLADMSWSSMLDAPFPLPFIWHADKFPPVLHSIIGGLTIAVEIAASLILMASPPASVFEFLSNVSMAALAVWSACVGNLNWSILTLLALSVGTIDEEIIAAVVGTDIFQRFGCKRVLAPLTEERVEKTIVKAIVPSIIFTIVVHLPAVLLALKYGSLGPVVSRDSVPAGLWSVLATIPGVLAVVYGLVGGGKNERGFSIRVAATLVAVATAWLIGTTDVVGYDMEGTLSSSILPVPYVRSAMVSEERGNFGPPVPHTLDGRSALTFHVQAEGMPNPDHSMEGVWELNMPYSVNSDQRPRFLSFYHPRVDYLVWKLHTQEEVEKLGSLKPFLVELLCTCLAMPEKCGRLAERVLLPKENEGDPRRRLVQDDLGRRALVAFSRKWEVTDDKYGLYWWSSAGSAAITGVPAGLMVTLPQGWCPQSAYRNPIFRIIAKVPITINEVSIGAITAGLIAKLLFGAGRRS
ncbi:hypothetical protein FOZ61_008317 [Perkinsus olseni]|uniref:Cyclophilin type peptidyl-prolyl cis-trans isomerase n=1 Tax=Perkinsus olseni TaxID=32597 RepID=A0A7J6L5C6_PEROL|nr:hypothetical protein FOZ61_008317 [Perkinsus olseni]KAF4658872.1 Cyclophilin type peptidyl-prolyl cis-trans isomerase [Perkinsus olseni]